MSHGVVKVGGGGTIHYQLIYPQELLGAGKKKLHQSSKVREMIYELFSPLPAQTLIYQSLPRSPIN